MKVGEYKVVDDYFPQWMIDGVLEILRALENQPLKQNIRGGQNNGSVRSRRYDPFLHHEGILSPVIPD